jgi:hypothetical protein
LDEIRRSEAAEVPLAITLNYFGFKPVSFNSVIYVEIYSVPGGGLLNMKSTSISNQTNFPIDLDINFDNRGHADQISILAQIISDG